MRRMKRLTLTGELFRHLLIQDGTRAIKVEGIPKDVQITAIYDDMLCDRIVLRLESDSFPEVPESCMVPDLVVTVTDVEVGTKRALQAVIDRIDSDSIAVVGATGLMAGVRKIAADALRAHGAFIPGEPIPYSPFNK